MTDLSFLLICTWQVRLKNPGGNTGDLGDVHTMGGINKGFRHGLRGDAKRPPARWRRSKPRHPDLRLPVRIDPNLANIRSDESCAETLSPRCFAELTRSATGLPACNELSRRADRLAGTLRRTS